MTAADLALALEGRFDPGPSTLHREGQAALARLIETKGYTLTGLARAMGRSHTWILRKIDPDQSEPRSLTLEDLAKILTFLEVGPEALATTTPDA